MSTVRSTLLLLALAIAGGVLFFSQVAALWPLMPGDLSARPALWRSRMMQLDRVLGTRLERYQMQSRVRVDGAALDYLERTCGRARTSAFIAQDRMPLAWHRVTLKEAGNPDGVTVLFLLDGALMGWERSVQDDAPAVEPEQAPESLARAAAERLVGDLADFRVVERDTRTMPGRTDRRWAFEREVPETGDPPLRERIQVDLAGDRVCRAMRSLVVPAPATRAARSHAAPIQGLEALGFSLLTVGAVIAAAIALIQLRRGGARLGPSAAVALAVAVALAATHALQPALLFESWDPLWPRWLAHARDLAYGLMDDATVLIPLLCFLIAGDALDRLPRGGGGAAPGRGRSLWLLARGRLAEPSVALASLRGFLVGAICGGVLAGGTLIALACGARVQLQPRGFFFYALNASSPALITVCFFAQIAVLEEIGYRYFAGTWLERLSGSRVLAIAIPAAVYGLCHTAFEFLPPADPFWVRPCLLAGVGAVWGWAFFRFDALTVVLSHLTCDLFIFNYPQLCAGSAAAGAAVAAISVPLWPALIGGLVQLARRPQPHQPHTPEV